MHYKFSTELGFSPEAREFVESGRQSEEINRRLFVKAGSAGVPGELEGTVRLLLVLSSGDALGDGGGFGEWETACAYEEASGDLVEVYRTTAGELVEGEDGLARIRRARARSSEIDGLCGLARAEAARKAWRAALGSCDPESDLAECFAGGERFPLVTRADIERWYLERRTLERDFSEELAAPVVRGADRLRAVYRPDSLVGDLSSAIGKGRFARLRVMESEWAELVRSQGPDVERACAANAALLDALDGAGAKSVKAVFGADGAESEHPVPSDVLARAARRGASLQLDAWDFTPCLGFDPDMTSFLGVKFRGKWIHRVA